MDTDTAMTIVEAIAELNRRAERISELERTLLSTQMQSEERLRRVRELEDERDIFARTLNKRDAENKRLREAIENAPHDGGCPLYGLRAESRWNPNSDEPCDCWKREALKNACMSYSGVEINETHFDSWDVELEGK